MTNSEIIETGKAGRPAGCGRSAVSVSGCRSHTKAACMACGICENTLATWRKQNDDLDPRIDAAREVARQTALEGIKTAGEKAQEQPSS
jgi:hypothetical protein